MMLSNGFLTSDRVGVGLRRFTFNADYQHPGFRYSQWQRASSCE